MHQPYFLDVQSLLVLGTIIFKGCQKFGGSLEKNKIEKLDWWMVYVRKE